jgi:UDP-N-acetylglucosamine 2-epimerase (non-hydrolysing)
VGGRNRLLRRGGFHLLARIVIAVVYGTRPEAIKLAPVVDALRMRGADVSVVWTGQHKTLTSGVDLVPDRSLHLMAPNQSPAEFVNNCSATLFRMWTRKEKPSRVVVQGDTATAFAAALTAFHLQIPVAHVEAGLRSGDLASPFPEEGYRRMISQIAYKHYAPTEDAAFNLRNSGISPSCIEVTGNTGIDAALASAKRDGNAVGDAPYVLVTLHRRESFGEPMRNVCQAIKYLAGTLDQEGNPLSFVLPMHPNPAVREVIRDELCDVPFVSLIEPMAYDDLNATLRGAWCVLTDSGGIQEEAPTFGIPCLIARETTERPEALESGSAKLVGLDTQRIVVAIQELRLFPDIYRRMAVPRSIFGDGHAAERIAADLVERP